MKDITTLALVGNPNSGKTTLFNLLTKSGEPCGNRAGVTFSAKTEPLRRFTKQKNAAVMDLPGIYSLSPYGNEEKAALRALKSGKVDVILNIVDATSLSRGLHLTLQLLSLGIPVVVALSMADELPSMGITIDTTRLAAKLGVPVFLISAAKGIGLQETIAACLSAKKIPLPLMSKPISETTAYIQELLSHSMQQEGARRRFDDSIDHCICRPIIGIPLFFLVMALVFFLTFSSLGAWISQAMEMGFAQIAICLRHVLQAMGTNELLCRLLTDGIWKGTSAVLSFMPQTAILFCLLAFLEDSGYLSRAVLVMDPLMRRFGVSGRAVIPMLIGFGCTVPAVMSATALEEEEKERLLFSLPFVPCSARLPVIMMIASACFPQHAAGMALFLYVVSIVAVFFSLLLAGKKESTTAPLLMELPKYRMPRPASLLREVKNKLRDFLVRAGTVVFLSCLAVDLLALFTPQLTLAEAADESILAHIGALAAPVFSCIGLHDGRLLSALAAGFFAKESIVSATEILIPEGVSAILTKAEALSFAVFSLLYLPCAASLSAIRKEAGSKKAVHLLLRTLIFAVFFSYIVYTFARILSK